MSSRGTHNKQPSKSTMFDSLWPQLFAHIVMTKAAKGAITPSKQSPYLCHSYNMPSCGGHLYLVNSISKFRIMVQDIWCHVQRMCGSVRYDSAPHTTHHISTSSTYLAKSSAKKATRGKKFQMLRLVPLDLVPHHHSP
jgi:hypothetical protein